LKEIVTMTLNSTKGSLLFLILGAIFICCKKYDTGPPVDPYSSNAFYVSFDDDGVRKEFRQGQNGVVNDAQSLYAFNTYQEMTVFSRKNSSVNENFTIDFARIFYSNPYQMQLDSLFTFQKYTNFGPVTSTEAGAIISHTDEHGFTWSTQNTGNAQIGSYVWIQYSFEEGGVGYRYTVKGTFSCLLYNTSSPGQYKNITNGTFTGKFGFGN
jgi:hypothetical protein